MGLNLGCDQTLLLEQLLIFIHLVAKQEVKQIFKKFSDEVTHFNWNLHVCEVRKCLALS